MQTKPNQTTPAPKPDAQPVQAASPARPNLGAPASAWADYNAAISAAGIRFQDKLDADFVAKAQPVQAASSTPETDAAQFFLPNAIGRVAGIVSVTLAQQLERQRNALQSALETIHEAGRMSDQPRAVYCALIAQDALTAAKGGAQ